MDYNEDKYRPGLGRDYPYPKIAHLYEIGENCLDFGRPMCRHGWNRDNGQAYSIWRGQVGEKGICKICLRRASRGKKGKEPRGIEF